MRINVSFNEAYGIFSTCADLMQKLQRDQKAVNGKFLYAIMRNREILRNQLKENEPKRPEASSELIAYSEKEKALVAKFEVEEEGKKTIKDQDTFKSELEALKAENKELLDAWQVQMTAYNELLFEEKSFEVYWIKEDLLPELTSEEMETLYKLIV